MKLAFVTTLSIVSTYCKDWSDFEDMYGTQKVMCDYINDHSFQNNPRSLVLIPDSGLGDLINSIHSAVFHAKVFDRTLKVLRDEKFACNFYGIENPYLFNKNTIVEPEEMKYWNEILYHVPKFRWPGSDNITIGDMSLSSGWKQVLDTDAKTMVVVSGNWHNHDTRKLVSASHNMPKLLQCISRWFFNSSNMIASQLHNSVTHFPCTSIHIRSIRYLRQSNLLSNSVHDDAAFKKHDMSAHMPAFCKYIRVAQSLNKKHKIYTKFVLFTDSSAVKKYVLNNCNSTNVEPSSYLDSTHVNRLLGDNHNECSKRNISHTLSQWYYMSKCSLHVNSESGFSMSAALLSNAPLAVVRSLHEYKMYPTILSAPIHYLG